MQKAEFVAGVGFLLLEEGLSLIGIQLSAILGYIFIIAGLGLLCLATKNWLIPETKFQQLNIGGPDPLASALGFDARVSDTNYKVGENVAGIRWFGDFVQVSLALTNHQSVPVYNGELSVQLDTAIAGIGQFTNFQDIEFFPVTPSMAPILWHTTDGEGKNRTVPLQLAPGTFPVSIPSIAKIRFRSLSVGITVHFVIASVVPNLPKKNPKWIIIKGFYETGLVDGGKRYPVEFSKKL